METKTTKVTKTQNKNNAVKPVKNAPNAAKAAGKLEVVTSFDLLRTVAKEDDKLVSFKCDPDLFKDLQLLGIKTGVAFCEVIKGLVIRELADVNGGSTLTHFIPALNV